MNIKRLVPLVSSVVALAGLASCATTGSHQAVDPVTEKIALFDKVDVKVTTKMSDADDAISTVKDAVTKALQPRFAPTEGLDGKKWPGTLGVELEITDFNRVSGGARMFLGPLAGKDRVAVKGTLIDLATNKQIGTFTGLGESSGGRGIQIGDAGVFRASAALGDEISKYLTQENM
jgi:hypothetical protein